MRRVGRDPPRPARPELARLVADREGHAPGDDHPQLLVLVAVPGHDRIGRELDEGKGDPLALDPPSADGLAPDVDDRHVRHVDQVAHGPSSARADDRRRASSNGLDVGRQVAAPGPNPVCDRDRADAGVGRQVGERARERRAWPAAELRSRGRTRSRAGSAPRGSRPTATRRRDGRRRSSRSGRRSPDSPRPPARVESP